MFTIQILSIIKHLQPQQHTNNLHNQTAYRLWCTVMSPLLNNGVHGVYSFLQLSHIQCNCSFIMCATIRWDSAERERDRVRRLSHWLRDQCALIRRAGPQSSRHCRGRSTEERLENKHLPQGQLLLPITSWCRNSTGHTGIGQYTHAHT